MKNVLFIAIMALCISFSAYSQEEKLTENFIYCELVGTGKMMSTKVNVQVDFGQKTSYWKGGSEKFLKDENGKKIEFNSMVDAMNYFGAQGWEFVQAYVVTVPGMSGQQNVYHWLLKKSVSKEVIQKIEAELEKPNDKKTSKDDD